MRRFRSAAARLFAAATDGLANTTRVSAAFPGTARVRTLSDEAIPLGQPTDSPGQGATGRAAPEGAGSPGRARAT